jgi:glycolate oxidase FAD binding subunit
VPLFAGSYGTLRLITEATFRLEPRHTVSRGTWLPCTDPEQAVQLAELAADPALAATGINVRWRADGSLGLLVMIQGERDDVQARAEQLCALAGRPARAPVDRARVVRLDSPDHGGLPPAVAQRLLAQREKIQAELRDPSPDTGTLVRVSFPPAELAAVLAGIRAVAGDCGVGTEIEGSFGSGVLEARVPAEFPAAAVARFVASLRAERGPTGSAGAAVAGVSVVYAPDEIRALTAPSAPAPALVQTVKDEFDPGHRMAPGRVADAGS